MSGKYINTFLLLLFTVFFMLPGPLFSWEQRRPFIYPVWGEVITGFRDEYYCQEGSSRRHTGIDIQGEPGDKVVASANGTVSYTGISPTGGLTIVIRHNSRIRTTYLNLAGIYVNVGNHVKQGDIIGSLGAYDDISNEKCHLHFAVIYGNMYLDPVQLLDIDYSRISGYLRLVYMERDLFIY
jgi:murein DD-endopeptidase MepM/ murein hydrolase activator NlpD